MLKKYYFCKFTVLLIYTFLIISLQVTAEEIAQKRLHILVCNDDGINSEGIDKLVEVLKTFADVTVAAPANDNTGVGKAVTVKGPIMVNEVKKKGEFFGYGIEATPATCVKIGLAKLAKKPVDLVVSGINDGLNTGKIIYNSGTFGAALEAVLNGIPAIAVSLEKPREKDDIMDYQGAAEFIKEFILSMQKLGFPKDKVININIPCGSKETWKGIEITKLSDFYFAEFWFPRKNPWGKLYYWGKVKRPTGWKPEPGTDHYAIDNKKISITAVPLIEHKIIKEPFKNLKIKFKNLQLD